MRCFAHLLCFFVGICEGFAEWQTAASGGELLRGVQTAAGRSLHLSLERCSIAVLRTRLRLDRAALAASMTKRGLADSPVCRLHPQCRMQRSEQTVAHALLHCPSITLQREQCRIQLRAGDGFARQSRSRQSGTKFLQRIQHHFHSSSGLFPPAVPSTRRNRQTRASNSLPLLQALQQATHGTLYIRATAPLSYSSLLLLSPRSLARCFSILHSPPPRYIVALPLSYLLALTCPHGCLCGCVLPSHSLPPHRNGSQSSNVPTHLRSLTLSSSLTLVAPVASTATARSIGLASSMRCDAIGAAASRKANQPDIRMAMLQPISACAIEWSVASGPHCDTLQANGPATCESNQRTAAANS